ncbi:MAG: extracellular solute-binding protein [Nakamurella sp.]
MTRNHIRTMAAVIVSVGALVVSACSSSTGASSANTSGGATGSQQSQASSTDTPVTLTVWGWLPDQASAFNGLFAKFTATHPNIKVQYQGYPVQNYQTQLNAGLSGSNGPDIATLQAYGGLQPNIDSGSLVAITDKTVPGISAFPTPILDAARSTKSGGIYGVPYAVQDLGVFYNEDIFAKYNLKAPTTWDEFIQACETLKKAGVIPMSWESKDANAQPRKHETMGAAVYGGPSFTSDFLAGKTKMTDKPFVDSFQVMKDIMPYLPPDFAALDDPGEQTLFTSGKAAMVTGGVWQIDTWRQAGVKNLGFFPMPPGPGAASDHPLVTFYVDGSFGINSKSPHQSAALELLNWMTTKDFGNAIATDVSMIPVVPGTKPTDPLVQEINAIQQKESNTFLCYAYLNGGSPTCSDLVSHAVQDVMTGGMSPADAAASVQKGLDQWFAPKK